LGRVTPNALGGKREQFTYQALIFDLPNPVV
jgi:hypothetical protein